MSFDEILDLTADVKFFFLMYFLSTTSFPAFSTNKPRHRRARGHIRHRRILSMSLPGNPRGCFRWITFSLYMRADKGSACGDANPEKRHAVKNVSKNGGEQKHHRRLLMRRHDTIGC